MPQNKIEKIFSDLTKNLNIFTNAVQEKKYRSMATSQWTVKDVLCHLTFWHTNYANNYRALAAKKEPVLLIGPGYKLNEIGVSSLRKYKTEELIKKLYTAHRSLYRSIVIHKVPHMTYKHNGPVYATNDFLQMITRHVHTHTQHVKRAR